MPPVPFKHKLEYFLTRAFYRLFCILPLSWAVKLGMAIGGFSYKIIGIRRKVALKNLETAFPQKSPSEREKIARQSYRHWGGMGAEFARLTKIDRRFITKYITFEGMDVIKKAVEGGKGCLIISGHLGNWEIMGAVSAQLGYKVTYIVASQSNKLVDKLMDDQRLANGIEIWKTNQAARGVLKSLRNNRFIALMIDQDAGRDCVFVDFFGKKASTHKGPAIFHLLKNTPLVMSSCIRIKGPYYHILFEEIKIPPFEGTKEGKITHITAHITKLLEEKIRQYPEQYFWMHKRWKTRPPENSI